MIRFILIMLTGLLTSIAIQAQDSDYRPFVEEGKVWEVGNFRALTNETTRGCKYYFEGDTIVAGKNCVRWMKDGQLLAPVFEENRKVFFFQKGTETPKLLYDFGAKAGESLQVYSLDGSCVTCYIDNVRVGEDGRRQLILHDSEVLDQWDTTYQPAGGTWDEFLQEFSYTWYEGFGTDTNPDYNIKLGGIVGNWNILVRVLVGNEVVYEDSYFHWIHDGVSSLHQNSSSAPSFFDFSGRPLTTPPARKGIYIRGGRKVMVK